MKDLICYYHSKDLDGWCSAAIVKEKYPEAQLIGYDYGEDFPFVPDKNIIMVDVSIPINDMVKYASQSKSWLWIDHHASAIRDYTALRADWSHWSTLPIESVLKVGIAACELTWVRMFPDKLTPRTVSLLGKYDTRRNEDLVEWEDEILPFQYGMRVQCNSPETFPYSLLRETGVSTTSKVLEIMGLGDKILRYQRSQDEYSATRSAFETKYGDLTVIAMNTNRFTSDAFRSVYRDHDLMMPFQFDGDKWKVSMYSTKDNVDCYVLAKARGGGGRKGAADFTVNNFEDIFNKTPQEPTPCV